MSEQATNANIAAALRRVLHEIGQEFGEKAEERVHSMLAYELEQVDPTIAWSNIMTDSWPLRPEQYAETFWGKRDRQVDTKPQL